jgi:hypothetical protein
MKKMLKTKKEFFDPNLGVMKETFKRSMNPTIIIALSQAKFRGSVD